VPPGPVCACWNPSPVVPPLVAAKLWLTWDIVIVRVSGQGADCEPSLLTAPGRSPLPSPTPQCRGPGGTELIDKSSSPGDAPQDLPLRVQLLLGQRPHDSRKVTPGTKMPCVKCWPILGILNVNVPLCWAPSAGTVRTGVGGFLAAGIVTEMMMGTLVEQA